MVSKGEYSAWTASILATTSTLLVDMPAESRARPGAYWSSPFSTLRQSTPKAQCTLSCLLCEASQELGWILQEWYLFGRRVSSSYGGMVEGKRDTDEDQCGGGSRDQV